jgi:hypothetical protein
MTPAKAGVFRPTSQTVDERTDRILDWYPMIDRMKLVELDALQT